MLLRSGRRARRALCGFATVVAVGLISTCGSPLASADTTSTSTPAPVDPTHVAPVASTWQGSIANTISGPDCTQLLAQIAAHPTPGAASCQAGVGSPTSSSSGLPPTPAPPSAPGVSVDAIPPNYQDNCAVSGYTNTWLYERNTYCVLLTNVLWETHDTSSGALLATATYNEQYASGFDAYSSTFNNFESFYMQSQSGPANWVPDILSSFVNQCSGCSGVYSSYPFATPQLLPYQTAVATNDDLSDNPASGAVDNDLSVSWIYSINCGSCTVPPGSSTITFPLAVRCDFQAGVNGYPGCVIPAFTPTLAMTGFAGQNTSTAFVSFMQKNNVDHWSQYPNGNLLHRLNDPGQSDINRRRMCAGFVAVSLNDSCDEFPFAATYQSGNMLGYTPSQCSQIYPASYNGVTGWSYVTYPGYSSTQHCGIGHVVLIDNTTAGGWYGNLVKAARLIDNDPFWIGIYN